MRLVRQWNSMLTEVAEASSLDLFEVRLEGTLSSLDLKIPQPMGVRLLWVISGVPFQPKPFHDSVILDPDDFSYG